MRINKEEFLANLRLTQAYCEQQLKHSTRDAVTVLRSINPDYREGKLFLYEENKFSTSSGKTPLLIVEWQKEADPYDNELFTAVFDQQLGAKKASLNTDPDSNFRGEIVLVEYDLDIADGASAIESERFVDSQDFPPIDTWFYRAYNGDGGWILFAWVPESFVALAQEAMDVHFLNIIHWFKDWSPAEYIRLTG